MTSYPIFLDLARCRVLVVGGGAVAARKVRGLLDAGGRPEIISPTICPELTEQVTRETLVWQARAYESGDARGYPLVFAATNQPQVNAAVAAEAAAHGALVNVADDGAGSTFHLPAVLREGNVVLALATGGAAPLLAKRLLARAAAVITPGVGRAAQRLIGVRTELRAHVPAEARRRDFWRRLITPDFLDSVIAGRDDDVEARIAQCRSAS